MSGLWNKWDDTVFVNQETGKKTYVDAHAEKKGFAEYHMLNAESWAVSNYIRYIVPEFEYNMVFWHHIFMNVTVNVHLLNLQKMVKILFKLKVYQKIWNYCLRFKKSK